MRRFPCTQSVSRPWPVLPLCASPVGQIMPAERHEHGQALLTIARAAIANTLGYPLHADEDAAWLQQPGACFVTLTQHERLRGCIGSLQAHRSLLHDVKANAVAAALHDPRFLPLSIEELAHTEIEVALLSALQALSFDSEAHALAQLRPQVDGIVFEYQEHRSIFLPQVWEQLPNPAEFMAQLKRRAGLKANFWDASVRLQRYTVTPWRERAPLTPR